MKVLIVGGVAGGATAAARLRRLDEHAEIIMFERGEYISFANCGLPYYVSDIIPKKSMLVLQTPESFNARYNVDVRVQNEVVSINKQGKTVAVLNHETGETYTESYDILLLSMGASPLVPKLPGVDLPGVFTLRTVPDVENIKNYISEHKAKKAVVIGGGFIGVEMAENLVFAGLDVTIAEMANQLIATVDSEMARFVQEHMLAQGVTLELENGLEAIEKNGEQLTVKLQRGSLNADIVILALGVRPETGIAQSAGLAIGTGGAIVVDKHMYTSDPNILAVGDAVEITNFVTQEKGLVPLAGPANKQGRIAADNIAGINSEYEGTQGSSVIKVFDLTVATTGINEKQAKKAGIAYNKVLFSALSHAGYYPGAKSTSIKVLFEEITGKILGGQFIGEDNADKRCDVLATAIRFGATAHDLTQLELCYAPPFGSAKDPINMAGYIIENILNDVVKQVTWAEVKALNKNDITLLDVRMPFEVESKPLPGFINIPINSLRENFDKIPKNKPVYVSCQSGQRSYVAVKILKGHGYDCYNISGGSMFS